MNVHKFSGATHIDLMEIFSDKIICFINYFLFIP